MKGAVAMFSYIGQDWQANAGNTKGRFLTISLRLGQLAHHSPPYLRWLFIPYRVFYKILTGYLMGIDLPLRTRIGPGLTLIHAHALVIHQNAVIGKNCHIKQCTTIGITARSPTAAPKIGDNVNVGCNSVLLGNITIGDNAIIGAGSVVVKDVPPFAVVAGNPARIVRFVSHTDQVVMPPP